MHELNNNIGQTVERRRQPPPSTADELLRQLPARELLDRMPAAVIGIGHDGRFVYANPGCASMLGYVDVTTLMAQPLPSLLAEHSLTSPRDCVALLQDAGNRVIHWSHADGFLISTTVTTLRLRATDPVLMVYISDVTELLWA